MLWRTLCSKFQIHHQLHLKFRKTPKFWCKSSRARQMKSSKHMIITNNRYFNSKTRSLYWKSIKATIHRQLELKVLASLAMSDQTSILINLWNRIMKHKSRMKTRLQRKENLAGSVTLMLISESIKMPKTRNRGRRYLKRTQETMVSVRPEKAKTRVKDRQLILQKTQAIPSRNMRSKYRTTPRMVLRKISMLLRRNRGWISQSQIPSKLLGSLRKTKTIQT